MFAGVLFGFRSCERVIITTSVLYLQVKNNLIMLILKKYILIIIFNLCYYESTFYRKFNCTKILKKFPGLTFFLTKKKKKQKQIENKLDPLVKVGRMGSNSHQYQSR